MIFFANDRTCDAVPALAGSGWGEGLQSRRQMVVGYAVAADFFA